MTVRRCDGARVRRCGSARVRGCEGARVRTCEGARVRRCDGAFRVCSGDPGRHGVASMGASFVFRGIRCQQANQALRDDYRGAVVESTLLDLYRREGRERQSGELGVRNAAGQRFVPPWLAPDRCCRGHRRHGRGVGVAQRKSNGQYQHDCPFRRSTAVRWRSANRRRRSTNRRGRASLIGIELYPRRGL